jgi:hypothetical protein
MWDLIKEIDWTDSAWKIAFFVVTIAFIFATYHLVKILGVRFMTLFDRLTTLSDKMDERIMMLEQDQKMNIERFKKVDERFEKNDKHIDMLISKLMMSK